MGMTIVIEIVLVRSYTIGNRFVVENNRRRIETSPPAPLPKLHFIVLHLQITLNQQKFFLNALKA
jgi:hypothetical protein